MIISLIAAMATNRVIGSKGRLPWHLPEDLARFRRLTWGHPIIMGRITYEGIGRPLPGRTTIVISRQTDYPLPDCIVTHGIDGALAAARATGTDEVFICGGGQVYRELLPLAHRIYLTVVQESPAGDTFFPDIPDDLFVLRSREPSPDSVPCTFLCYERRLPATP